MDFLDGVLCFLLGLIVGVLVAGILIGEEHKREVEQLGKSICEEEYGMDFESYYEGVLRCKPFKETYDGIRVEVPKAQG